MMAVHHLRSTAVSASLGEITTQPVVADVHASGLAHPPPSPEPSGPPTSSSTAAVPGTGSATTSANADGSITTTVTDSLGNIVATSTSPPAVQSGASAHPMLNIEA